MKEKFIELCKSSDLVVMGGIPMEYLPSCNQLSYRVLGEYNYFSLDEIEESEDEDECGCGHCHHDHE